MPNETEATTPPNTTDPNTQAPAAGAAPAAAPASPPTSEPKIIHMPSRALKEKVDHAREQGKSLRNEELDREAQTKGFASHADMISFVETMRKGQQQPPKQPQGSQPPASSAPPTPPRNPNDRKAMQQYERDLERARQEAKKANDLIAQANRRARKAEQKAEAAETRAVLERMAFEVGIKNVGYAIHLLTQRCEGMTDAELEAFDERKFFEGLRATDAYLFGETVVPATTGTGGARPQATVPPAHAAGKAAADGQIDMRTASPQDVAAFKRKMGIETHSWGG